MTEVVIMLIFIIMALCLLLRFMLVKRRVIVTIVKNLPIGIFKDKNKSYETENKVYVKEISRDHAKSDSDLNETDSCTDNGQDQSIETANADISDENSNGIVYWTPNGKTYHMSTSCFALCRSKVINHGTIEESGKDTLCDLCKDNL